MQIQKVNAQQSPNFGARQVIITKDARILNELTGSSLGPKCMFRHLLSLGADEKGFSQGLLVDGVEKKAFDGLEDLLAAEMGSPKIKDCTDLSQMVSNLQTRIVLKAGRAKIISKWQDLLELPILAGCKDKIAKLFKNF